MTANFLRNHDKNAIRSVTPLVVDNPTQNSLYQVGHVPFELSHSFNA